MRIGVSSGDRVWDVADTVGSAARVFEIVGVDDCCTRFIVAIRAAAKHR